MSNCETFNLPVLEVEPHQVKEALRCVLHSIIFNRALGYVQPKDVESELFDVTYVHCGDQEVDKKVEAKLNEFCTFIERKPAELHQLSLSFFELRKKQAWFGTQDERLFWEQWCVNVMVLQPDVALQQQGGHPGLAQVRAQRQARLQASIEELIAFVVRCVNDKRDHIPPVVSASAITFPFDITFSGGNRSVFGLHAVKKMLLQATPPPVLS